MNSSNGETAPISDVTPGPSRTESFGDTSRLSFRAVHTRHRSTNGSDAAVASPSDPLLDDRGRRRPTRSVTTDTELLNLPTDKELSNAYRYPNPGLGPHFSRKHVSMLAISGAIGTGLFLGSGQSLYNAGPLGLVMGYAIMSSAVYGFIVSSAEMVAVYPYCRGTVGLADRFVDPALGFAMGWNAWYHWGLVVPSQIAAATSLIKYWNPASQFAPMWTTILIFITSSSVFASQIFGEIHSVFASLKICAVVALLLFSLIYDSKQAARDVSPFRFWKTPFQQYLGISGSWGQLLGFFSVFIQAAFSFFGTEIPSLLAAEVRDAPRVIASVSRRVWLRMTLIYILSTFAAGTLVSPQSMKTRSIIPGDHSSPENDAPWVYSPFLVALGMAGAHPWILNLFVALFITSAVSAASAEILISARYLAYLSKAGHAPRILGKTWPNTEAAKKAGTVVPWVAILTTGAFSTLSFMAMRPHENTMSGQEITFKSITSMTSAASLQAWVGTLTTYLRFYYGTLNKQNIAKFSDEIERIKENRAKGQPYWAMYSFSICALILMFNGWNLFNSKNGKWVIYYSPEVGVFPRNQVLRFVTTYIPIPMFLFLLFGYKLIKQTSFIRTKNMNYSGVAMPTGPVLEPKPKAKYIFQRIWWILVK